MKSLNNLEFIGATLTIVGSFLPWEQAGDFVSMVTRGVQIDFADFKYWMTGIHIFPVYDNGGVMVILLTSLIMLLGKQPPKPIKNPTLWKLIVSGFLMGLSLFFVVRWLMHRYGYGDAIGQPTLMIGLICVVLGSAILLWRAVITHYQIGYHQSQSAG
jgi:hypothetical protein